MRRLTRLATIAAAALPLANCGGGDAPAPGASTDYLAMAIGNRWTYSNSRSGTNYGSLDVPSLEELVSPEAAMSAATYKRQGAPLVGNSYYYAYFNVTPDALVQVFDPGFTSFPGYLGSQATLHLPLRSGDHYFTVDVTGQDLGTDTDSDGINETVDQSNEITVGGIETVTVPAGTFSNALKVSAHYYNRITRSQDGSQFILTADSSTWYVPGVGIVKATSTLDGTNGPGTTTRLLTGYRTSLHRTDTTAPTVTLTSPATGGSMASLSYGMPTPVTMTFSEDMDPFSVVFLAPGGTSLVIRDAGNAEVSGTLQYNDKQLAFTPDAAMATGAYTATLTGATDALGNALPTYTWNFSIN